MKVLSPLGRQKKGISAMVAYVLLISITLSMSILVYNWLKFYVEDSDIPECPAGVSLVIKDYNCTRSTSSVDGSLEITLQNKGRFSIEGYLLKAHDRVGAEFGLYLLEKSEIGLEPGKEVSKTYDFGDIDDGVDDLTLVEVQPFRKDGDQIICQSVAIQNIQCN